MTNNFCSTFDNIYQEAVEEMAGSLKAIEIVLLHMIDKYTDRNNEGIVVKYFTRAKFDDDVSLGEKIRICGCDVIVHSNLSYYQIFDILQSKDLIERPRLESWGSIWSYDWQSTRFGNSVATECLKYFS